jgi:hypothetical protein
VLSNDLKNILCFCLLFALFCLPLTPSRTFAISAPNRPAYAIQAQGKWVVNPKADVVNASTLNKLIACESQGTNISRPDKGDLYSDGILQFHRGASNVMGSGTWSDMEATFHFTGSPINPSDAVHMADLMISGGYLGRWTCAHLLGLVRN